MSEDPAEAAAHLDLLLSDAALGALRRFIPGRSTDDDPLIPLTNARVMHALIPHSSLHVYHGGHLDLVTEAASMAPVVSDFLARP
jgi:pimeloyl-ACP methyl ester carboxylesterase